MAKVDTSQLTKLYYSISEVAEMFNVNMSLIRFWEKEFPALQPKKNKRGNRYYSPKEIEKLNRIFELVKEKGYTLDGAKKALRSKKQDISELQGSDVEIQTNQEAIVKRLEIIKSKLVEFKDRL